jgi:N-acetylglucosamine kinase-like BadF-type ATPase
MEEGMAAHVMGVDGGTTKTIALVADGEGRIIGASWGRGSNWSGEDVEIPMAVVVATAQEALCRADLTGNDIDMAVFGLAGADWPEDYVRRQEVLERSGIARRLLVKNDTLVGLRAGTRRPYGIVIVAGTGTNTAVIAPDGREWVYGYYAFYGGAKDIAREGIHAAFREEDGRGPRTALTGTVLEKLGYASPEALMKAMIAGQVEESKILSLCPLVFTAADTGDEVAAAIVVNQGLALAEYTTALIRRYGLANHEFDVVLSGSVFKGQGPLLCDTITQVIHRVAPRARVVRAQFEPAVGGLLLAYDALGLAMSEAMYDALVQTAPGARFFSTVDGG